MESEYVYFFLLTMLPYALGTAHFACTMVLLIRWAVLRSARSRDRIIRPDMHKYASITYPRSFKVLALIVIGGYLLVIIPAIVWAIALALHASNPLISAIIAAIIGFICLAALIRLPLSHKESAAIVDSRGLTIEYKDGEKNTIGVRGYKGYLGQTKKRGFRLVYEGEDGKDEYVYLPFLSERDAILVGQDLISLRDHGCIEPPKAQKPAAQPAAAPVSIPVRTHEEQKKIEEKIAYTDPINAGGEIGDKAKYRDYLEDVLAKIPFEKRDEIIKLVLQGNKIEAMRVCQRASGEGLKIASDLFGNYLMFPNLKYFNCRICVRIADSSKIRDSFREYNGIYTDPDKCYISAEGDLGDNWHYIELSASTSDPADFSFAEFMNILIWMGDLTHDVFAYAKPNNTYPGMGSSAVDKVGDWTNTEPFYAEPDRNDELTESCVGIMNGKEFRFVVTELAVSYKKELNSGSDVESYISKKHRVKLS